MLPIRWRAEAQADLTAILDYVAKRNARAAMDLYHTIDRLISQLPQHAYLYRAGRIAGTRELPVHSNYLVVYRVGTAAIGILSVIHSRQQYP